MEFTLIGVLLAALLGAFMGLYKKLMVLDHKVSVKEKEKRYFEKMKNRLVNELSRLDSEPLRQALEDFFKELFIQTSIPQICMGEESLPGRLKSSTSQKKAVLIPVEFPDGVFSEPPEVHISLKRIDLEGGIHRMEVQAVDITKDGFKLVFKTWFGSTVYTAKAAWLAIGR